MALQMALQMAFTTVGMATSMRIAFWMVPAPLASAEF
jgi:hypothetical protein